MKALKGQRLNDINMDDLGRKTLKDWVGTIIISLLNCFVSQPNHSLLDRGRIIHNLRVENNAKSINSTTKSIPKNRICNNDMKNFFENFIIHFSKGDHNHCHKRKLNLVNTNNLKIDIPFVYNSSCSTL